MPKVALPKKQLFLIWSCCQKLSAPYKEGMAVVEITKVTLKECIIEATP